MNKANNRSKIIYFPYKPPAKNKQRPLSPLMVDTLLTACSRQKEGIVYGPADIKGSFVRLIDRGLIIRKEVTTWEVTPEAIGILKSMGIEVPL